MRNLVLYPYKMGSSSARKLADTLNSRRVYPNRRYRAKGSPIVLNWGNSVVPEWDHEGVRWINRPASVALACDKEQCSSVLEVMSVPIVPTTKDIHHAADWQRQGYRVVERHVNNGHSGAGIVVKNTDEDLSSAHFYTQYLGSRREYRVHVFNGEVLLVVQKKKRDGWRDNPSYSDEVRNWHNGWVYAADGITELPSYAVAEAIAAVECLGLVFGAVDVITKQDQVYVLEVNTAPGLEGRTVELYSNAIKEYV